MKWKEYFLEYALFFGCYVFLILLFALFFFSFHVEMPFIILFMLLFLGFGLLVLLYFYYKKKRFYNSMFETLLELDQKYLITEMDVNADFLDAKKFMDMLNDIDKSMNEKIGFLEQMNLGFRDYIELWIHEVKIPISNLILMFHNGEYEKQMVLEQVNRIENLVEQVLFYARSETLEKDYFIKKTLLQDVVNDVVKKNKDAFILGKILIDVSEVSGEVLTDQKWLIFILNQILSNSIKYRKDDYAQIKMKSIISSHQVVLKIWDNGIGIRSSEIERVFDKSFTGSNGRMISASTGMGLFIVKNLIQKLGHQISIESKEGEYTEVSITFSSYDFYDVVTKQ